MWRVSKVHLGWSCSTQCYCMLLYVPHSMCLFFSQQAFGLFIPFVVTVLLWTFVYNFFGGCVVLIALDVYLAVGFTGSLAILHSTLKNCLPRCSPQWPHHRHSNQQCARVPVSPYACRRFALVFSTLSVDIPGSVKWSMLTSVIDLVSLGAPHFSLLG